MLRLALFIVAAAFLTLVYYNHERISLATTLVATFVEFPRSNVNVISIPSNPADFTPSTNDTIVPAIIHQVLLGDLEMRPKWEQARSSCLELHPTWDFKLWKSHESNQFVQEYYPQIYSTYRYYPLEIQRSNVLRYLLLDRYGGMYLDLDMRCRQNLDFLRGEEFLTPPANPTGINNAFIVSKKGHPFWTHVVDHLIQYDIDWYTPYLTNMFSTGCHFLSTMHRTYSDQIHLKILDSSHKLNGHVVTPLFEHLGASSWHKKDAKMILRLGLFVERIKAFSHIIECASAAFVVFAVLLYVARRRHQIKKTKGEYQVLPRWEMQQNYYS